MTADNHAYVSRFHESRDPDRVHECNLYCEPGQGIHCSVAYSDEPYGSDDVAIEQRGRIYDILRIADAPEAPDSPNWKCKQLLWTRRRTALNEV